MKKVSFMKTRLFAILVALSCVTCMTLPAFAADEAATAPTLSELLELLMAAGTAVAAAASAIAAMLPRESALAHFLTRWFPDFRGHRQPTTPPKSGSGINGAIVLTLSVLLVTGCNVFERIDWPKKLECLPANADLIGLVGTALRDEDWQSELDELAFDRDSGAVLCAVRQVVDDLSQDSAAGGPTWRVELRGRLYLAESGTEIASP